MAKRKTRRVYVRPKTRRRRSNSSGGRGWKKLIKPIAAGAIAGVLGKMAPSLPYVGRSYTTLAAGYIIKDGVLQTIGAYQLGQALASSFTGGNGTTNGTNFWEG